MKWRWQKDEGKEIEYEPKSVKELLTEMKDLSELIIDLGYSSLIFDSEEMADEVITIEEKMDKLLYQIRMTTMMGCRTVEDAEQLSGILQVASAAENISNAAGDIAALVETDIDTRPFLPFVLADADEVIKALIIEPDSSMIGRSLGELDIENEARMILIAMRRRKHWIYDPDDDIILKAADRIVVRGSDEGYKYLKQFCEEGKPWPTHTSSGGGN